jgi:probable phosphoglycerate mutase
MSSATEAPSDGSQRSVLAVLVRHGESLWNAEKRFQGQAGTGLSDRGFRQAKAAAEYLTQMFPPFDVAISSDLQRVAQTADAFEAQSGMPIKRDPQWREINIGAWSGLTAVEVAASFPDELAASRRGEDIPRGGGETFAQLRTRIKEALLGLAAHALDDQAETRIVAFTHGGPITVAAAEALDLPPGRRFSLGPPVNCSVTSIRLDVRPAPGSPEVERVTLMSYNSPTSTAHLEPAAAAD